MSDDTETKTQPDPKPSEPNPKKRGLGRGLDALFGDEEVRDAVDQSAAPSTDRSKRQMIGVDQLQPGVYQPRQHMNEDALDDLARSIATHGVLQPLLVRPLKDAAKEGGVAQFEIIAGERRWRAAQKVQLHDVPVLIRELSDLEALEIALVENLQRSDLDAIEEAQGYRRLMDEFGHTQEKLAEALGKSRSHIANSLRLLNLPEAVQAYVSEGKLSAGHARALITADDPKALADEILRKSLSVRDAEKLVAQAKAGNGDGKNRKAKKSKSPSSAKDPDTRALEEEVSQLLGMKVSIESDAGGAGRLSIEYKTLDQLDELLHRLSHFPGRRQTG